MRWNLDQFYTNELRDFHENNCNFFGPNIQIRNTFTNRDGSYPLKYFNSIDDVIVIILASSAVDRGFEPRYGQTKDYNIGTCRFYAKHSTLRSKSKDLLVLVE